MRKLLLHLSLYLPFLLIIICAEAQHDHVCAHKPRKHQGNLSFVENKGQWHENVLLQARFPSAYVYLERNRLKYLLMKPEQFAQLHPKRTTDVLDMHCFSANFLNSNSAAEIEAREPTGHSANYILGSDPSRWASGARAFARTTYRELYDNIDLELYFDKNQLKYDFIVRPGASPASIQWQYAGAEAVRIEGDRLIVETSVGEVVEQIPVAYQIVKGEKREVQCLFRKVCENTVGFSFPKGYDAKFPLVIDPLLIFSTYTGSTADNWGMTACFDDAGNLYTGGVVNGVGTYPVSEGAFQLRWAGGFMYQFVNGVDTRRNLYFDSDMAITKYNETGTRALYSTYIGGRHNDQPASTITDAQGNLYILGATRSDNFPTTSGAYDTELNGEYITGASEGDIDIVVVKLNPEGTGLVGSTYLGGTGLDGVNTVDLNGGNPLYFFYADDGRGEIMLDESNNVYIATSTRSNDLPVTPGAFQTAFGGEQDACIAKFNSNLTSLEWCSYLGGPDYDAGYGLRVREDGNVYFCGGTEGGLPFPGGGWLPTYQGGAADGYVALVSGGGNELLAGTYVGGAGYDQTYLLDLDEEGRVNFVGQTMSDYPTLAAGFNQPRGSQYITRLNPELAEPDLSLRFGSGRRACDVTPTAFMVDVCGNIYFAGWGSPHMPPLGRMFGGSGNTRGLRVTPDARQPETDSSDFYLMVLEPDAAGLSYATFFGGDIAADHVDGGTSRFDPKGVVYHSSCASCGGLDDFPTTPGAFSRVNGSGNCNNGSFKMDFDFFNGVLADFRNLELDTVEGCAPFRYQFINQSSGATRFEWTFGDGTPTSTEESPIHVYEEAGLYEIVLRAYNDQSCNGSDVATRFVRVYERAELEFDVESDPCTGETEFFNKSVKGFNYRWEFGDGGTSEEDVPPNRIYEPGDYPVTIISNPGTRCSDTLTETITVPPPEAAGFAAEQVKCEPVLRLTSLYDNLDYRWFVDGVEFSAEVNPMLELDGYPDSVLVRQIVNNGLPCEDTADVYVPLDVRPEVDFTWPENCSRAVNFVNNSFRTEQYKWVIENRRDTILDKHLSYVFPESGKYTVKLIGNYDGECKDSMVREVDVRENPTARFRVRQKKCDPTIELINESSGALTYKWEISDGTELSGDAETHTFDTTGVYTVILVANPDSFCLQTATKIVEILPPAEAEIGYDPFACERVVQFRDSSRFASTFIWNFGDGTKGTGRNPRHVFPEPGEYEIELIVNAETPACADTVKETLEILEIPTADFRYETDSCSADVRFEAFGAGVKQWDWNMGDGRFRKVAEFTHDFPGPGRYLIDLTVNKDSPCPVTLQRAVRVPEFPMPALIHPDTTCDTVRALLAEIPYADSIRWHVDGQFISEDRKPVFFFPETGRSYAIRLDAWMKGGHCPASVEDTIYIQATPTAGFYAVQDPCAYDVALVNNSSGATHYRWDLGDGSTSTSADTVRHTYAADGFFEVILEANPDSVCSGLAIDTLNVGAVDLDPSFDPLVEKCDSVLTYELDAPGAVSWRWTFSDGDTLLGKDVRKVFENTGLYEITLTVNEGLPCESSVVRTVEVLNRPVAEFETTQEPCGPEITVTNTSRNAVKYLWSMGEGRFDDEEHPVFSFAQDGQYRLALVATDLDGCTDTAITTLDYDRLGIQYIYIPNVFTPNGDGRNDEFVILGPYSSCIDHVMIFNRWGNKIYKTPTPSDAWDGTFDGKPVPEGAYVYVVQADGRKRVGTVTVLR